MNAFTAVTQKGKCECAFLAVRARSKNEKLRGKWRKKRMRKKTREKPEAGHRGMPNRSNRSRTTAFHEDFYEIIGRSGIPLLDPVVAIRFRNRADNEHPPGTIFGAGRIAGAHFATRNWSMSVSRISRAHSMAAKSNESRVRNDAACSSHA